MKLTIYNTFVLMESQEQCDRMKQLCIDNELPYWNDYIAFRMIEKENWFEYNNFLEEFYITSENKKEIKSKKTQVTEKEFINLLNTK